MTPDNGPSWAGDGLDQALAVPPADSIPAGSALVSIRLQNDGMGNLDLLVMGRGPFPVMHWVLPKEYIDEARIDDAGVIVQVDVDNPTATLYTPPGYTASFIGAAADPVA